MTVTYLLLQPWMTLLMTALPAMAAFLLLGAVRRRYLKVLRLRDDLRTDQCPCGYPLKNLQAARCPECGRVAHFDVTAEELGLTTEQLERAQAAKLRRNSLDSTETRSK